MRGYGAPNAESTTAPLTLPDWGWGDVPPATWAAGTADYGYGSARGATDINAYIHAHSLRVGDDGGYILEIIGQWPRLGASVAQRPTGFSVSCEAGGVTFPCYAGRAGQAFSASTDIRGRVLSAYTPRLDVGAYAVVVAFDGTSLNVGNITVERRLRTRAEYSMRAALPLFYTTGPRRFSLEGVLDSAAPSARDDETGLLRVLFRSIGQSMDELHARGLMTRTAADFNIGDNTLTLESTLGFPAAGGVFLGSTHLKYTGTTTTTLTGVTAPTGLLSRIERGERVFYDPHTIAD